MSSFAKRNGRLGLYLSSKIAMIIFTHGPNCIMNYSSACLVVAELIESMISPLRLKRNDRSMMVLNSLNFYGIIATRKILRFTGVFPLIPPYRTTLVYPFLTLSAVLACRTAMAANEVDKGCGSQSRAA